MSSSSSSSPAAAAAAGKRGGAGSSSAAAPVPGLGELRALLCPGDNPEAFQVPAFIDGLVRPLLLGQQQSKAAGGSGGGMEFGFDPAALTDLFSATLERLHALGAEVDGKIAALEEEGRRLAPQRRRELDRHHGQLQEVHGTIEDIEAHFRKVGLTAVRIGQSLSQTEAQREKAEHAQRLLEYFLAFDTLNFEGMLKDAETERIEMLANDTLAPLVDEANFQAAAAIVRDLNVVCEDLNAPHLDNAVRCVRVFGERLEQRLLDRFEEAAMAESVAAFLPGTVMAAAAAAGGGTKEEDAGPDVATMRACAHALLEFGDAVKLYNTYIYTIVAKQVQAQNASSSSYASAAAARGSSSNKGRRAASVGDDGGEEEEEEDDDDEGVDSEAAAMETRDNLSEFFGLISALCQRAFTLIRVVFPPSASLKVTRMLIDRMVNDPAFGIQVRVAQVLEEEESKGTVLSVSDSLDTLLMVHDKTQALANDLIDHCQAAERNYLEATRHRSSAIEEEKAEAAQGPAAAAAAAGAAAPAAAGTTSTDRRHATGAAGAAGGSSTSSRSHEALSSYVTTQFAELFVGQRDSYLEKEVSLLRLRLVELLAAQMAGEDAPGLDGRQAQAPGGRKGGRRSLAGAGGQEPPDLPALRHERVEGYDQMLQAWLRKEVLQAALEHTREAVGRNAKMFRQQDGDRAGNVLEMVSVLHKFLGTSVLLPSLSAASNLAQLGAPNAPPPSFYAVLRAVHLWVDAYKAFVRDVALPEVCTRTTTQTVLLEGCRKFLLRVERAGAKTVERGLEAVLRAAERLHREGVAKSDYLPKDNTLLELQPTRACLDLRDLLTTHVELLCRHLPPKDVRVIVSSLALRVQALLMARLKQLRINTSGALVLMQDVEIIYGCFALPPFTATGPTTTATSGAERSMDGGAASSSSSSNSVNAPEVKRVFDDLKEVAGLFCVDPQNLKGLMEHGYLSTQDKADLFLYVSNRADFRHHGFMAPWVKTIFGPDVRDHEGTGAGGATSPTPPPPEDSLHTGGGTGSRGGSRSGSPVAGSSRLGSGR